MKWTTFQFARNAVSKRKTRGRPMPGGLVLEPLEVRFAPSTNVLSYHNDKCQHGSERDGNHADPGQREPEHVRQALFDGCRRSSLCPAVNHDRREHHRGSDNMAEKSREASRQKVSVHPEGDHLKGLLLTWTASRIEANRQLMRNGKGGHSLVSWRYLPLFGNSCVRPTRNAPGHRG
jgi:hypothetical protein